MRLAARVRLACAERRTQGARIAALLARPRTAIGPPAAVWRPGLHFQQPQDRIRLTGLLPRGLLPIGRGLSHIECSGVDAEGRRTGRGGAKRRVAVSEEAGGHHGGRGA